MDTKQIIKNAYEELPSDMKLAIQNTDLSNKFNLISDKYNLHIDQTGNLQTETLLVMLGLETTSDFVANLQRELEIEETEAKSIAQDINMEIFSGIKTSLREINDEIIRSENKVNSVETYNQIPLTPTPQPPSPPPTPTPKPTQPPPPQTPKPITQPQPTNPKPTFVVPKPVETVGTTPIEQAGRFTIEKPPVGVSNESQNKNFTMNKDAVLKGIEDPEVNMIDHLLTTPVSTAEKVEAKKPIIQKPIESKPPGVDPYREPI